MDFYELASGENYQKLFPFLDTDEKMQNWVGEVIVIDIIFYGLQINGICCVPDSFHNWAYFCNEFVWMPNHYNRMKVEWEKLENK